MYLLSLAASHNTFSPTSRSNEFDYGLAGIRLQMHYRDYMRRKLLLPVPISKIILNILSELLV